MTSSYVSPRRGFNDSREIWGRNELLLDDTLKLDGGYDNLKKKFGDHGVRFTQLSGPLPSSQLAANDSLCTPIQTKVPMDSNKRNVLQYWAYPNGEFSPVIEISHNVFYQPYGSNNSGNPNGGNDYIKTQPTQPTIPPLNQQTSEPNSSKIYADYRNIQTSNKSTDWTIPQYYRSGYLGSDMECSISTKTFVTTQSGPKGDFPLLQMYNGYKLLDDGVTVVPTTDDRSGEALYVTCNPGLFPRDMRSSEYMQTMTNYCGKGNISFYQDSQYNAYPNPNRSDDEGNPLGGGTLQRFNSNTCQNFCTLYPTACKKPFQDWCSNITNWTLQGTCYAMANIVRNTVPEEENAVVPTLRGLCQNENLDTDVCKTFCFAANTSSLNCQAPLISYCGKLIEQKLQSIGNLVVNQNTLSTAIAFTFEYNYVDAFFNTSPTEAPYNVEDSVILANVIDGTSVAKDDYKFISCRGYIADGFVNITTPAAGINLTYHKFCSDSANDFTGDNMRNYFSPLNDTTRFLNPADGKYYIALTFTAGSLDPLLPSPIPEQNSTISELYIWQGSGTVNANFALLSGYRRTTNLSALNSAYTVCIDDVPLFDPTGADANTFITPLQPFVFSNDISLTETVFPIIDAAPFNWVTGSGGGGTYFTKFAINNKTLAVGNVNSPVLFEINKFFSSYQGSSSTTVLLALNPERANLGRSNAFLFKDGTTDVTGSLNSLQGSSFTITQPSGNGPPIIKKTPDGNFITYSNDIVQQAAEAVYGEHPQCPCFMPSWVYNHYYDELFAEFPDSAPLQAFIETISTNPICNYPQCSIQVNGSTQYIPRVNDVCPNVTQCLQNARISIDRIGYLAKTNFQVHNTLEDLACNQRLSTFNVFEDTGLFGTLDTETSFYDTLYEGSGLITMKVFRAALKGAGNTKPIIPVPPSSFYGYIIGNNTLIFTRTNRGLNPPPNFASVTGEANTLVAQGIRPGTFLQGEPVPYGGVGSGMFSYALGGGNYTASTDTLGSASNNVLFTVQGDNPALINTASINPVTPGAPCPVDYYVQTTKDRIVPVNYKVGDSVHVYETNRWRDFYSTTPSAFLGYITTPTTGNSVLTVVSNTGPIGPGLIQSLNNVLPNTLILQVLTGLGRPFAGAGSTWLLNQRYTNTLGSSTAPIQMYMTPRSTLRWFNGLIKEIYPDTVNEGYFYITINMLDTNEDSDQLKWSKASDNYASQNSQGQVAECLSISYDQEDTVLPSGDEITPETWYDVYDFDVHTGVAYQEYFPEDKVTTSSSTLLIVIIIVVVLVLIIFVTYIKIRQKNKLLKESEMNEESSSYDTNNYENNTENTTTSSTSETTNTEATTKTE